MLITGNIVTTNIISVDGGDGLIVLKTNVLVTGDLRSTNIVSDSGLLVLKTNVFITGTVSASGVFTADEAYDASTWDGLLTVPTKNAIRDKFESLGSGGLFYSFNSGQFSAVLVTNISISEGSILTNVSGSSHFSSVSSVEIDLGTIANGETGTLVLSTNVSHAVYSGATATIALPSLSIATNSYQLLHFGTNTSGGTQIITIPSLLRDELSGTSLVTTITNNVGVGFRILFESVGGVWSRVSATGDALTIAAVPVEIIGAASDELTAITTGTNKLVFRAPYAFTLTAVKASVTTAPTGSTILIDINENGTSVINTKLMINASSKTSVGAATPYVITDSSIADDAEISIDFDQVGSSVAGSGVKITLLGHR